MKIAVPQKWLGYFVRNIFDHYLPALILQTCVEITTVWSAKYGHMTRGSVEKLADGWRWLSPDVSRFKDVAVFVVITFFTTPCTFSWAQAEIDAYIAIAYYDVWKLANDLSLCYAINRNDSSTYGRDTEQYFLNTSKLWVVKVDLLDVFNDQWP